MGEGLLKLGYVPKEEIDMIVPHFPSKIDAGTEFRMTVKPIEGQLLLAGETHGGPSVLNVPAVVRGLHDIYFGQKPVLKGVNDSLQRLQPWLWCVQEPDEPEPDQRTGGALDCS